MKKILEISNLKKNYHTNNEEVCALNDISFDIYEGEYDYIVCSSGCGKSTILSILNNIIDKSEGNISILNGYKLAYMLQDDCLLPFKTVMENCLIGLRVNNNLTEESKEYVIELLRKYGLYDFMNKYPSNLSGGMRQRCALIRTLALKPGILLLDEAVSSLDYQTRLNIGEDFDFNFIL